jgi:hypothetical protein
VAQHADAHPGARELLDTPRADDDAPAGIPVLRVLGHPLDDASCPTLMLLDLSVHRGALGIRRNPGCVVVRSMSGNRPLPAGEGSSGLTPMNWTLCGDRIAAGAVG